MTVIDLLPVLDEFKKVSVYNRDCQKLGMYDGRNSIDEELNDYPVWKVTCYENELMIIVDDYLVVPWRI